MLGMVCLFSLNFLQGTIIGAILAWGVLIQMIVAHCFAFLRETGQKYHNISLLVYYSMLFAWFGGETLFFVIDAFWSSINIWSFMETKLLNKYLIGWSLWESKSQSLSMWIFIRSIYFLFWNIFVIWMLITWRWIIVHMI